MLNIVKLEEDKLTDESDLAAQEIIKCLHVLCESTSSEMTVKLFHQSRPLLEASLGS